MHQKSVLLISVLFLTGLLQHTRLTAQTTIADSNIHKADTTVYDKVDQQAAFRGSWLNHLQSNLNMRVPVNNGAPDGSYTVEIGFVVNADGSLSHFSRLSNVGYGMEEETIRIIRKSKKWTPALINGKAVRSYKKQKLTFSVNRR